MDFRGMKWVGNVYEKFEALCMEVEDIIVQDTAKYVENRVQTVGATVKKFCSDVVQDMLVESEKPLSPSTLHDYDSAGSMSKKTESVNEESKDGREDQLMSKDDTWVIRDQWRDGYEMKFRGVHAENDHLRVYQRQGSDNGPYRRTKLGAKIIFRKEKLSTVMRHQIEKDSNLGIVDVPRENDMKSLSDSTAEVERFDGNGDDHVLTAVGSVRSQDSMTEQSAAPDVDRADETDEDSWDWSYVSEQNTKTLQQLSQSPVEESCILVDRDEVLLPHKHAKHKSYKKIRDVMYSRMRPTRAQEYKRLNGQWEGESVEFGTEVNRSLVNQTAESDWELL